MVEDKWLLIASIPVVVFLGISIRRRLRDLNDRIEQLKRDEAAGPVNPYQAMSEMIPGDIGQPGSKGINPLLLKAMGKSTATNGLKQEPDNLTDGDESKQ